MVVLKYGTPRGCKKSPSTGCWLSVTSEDYVSTIASKPWGEEHCQPGHSFSSKYLWQYAIIPYVCVMLYGVQNASRAPPHLIFTTVLCDKSLELRSTFQFLFKKKSSSLAVSALFLALAFSLTISLGTMKREKISLGESKGYWVDRG